MHAKPAGARRSRRARSVAEGTFLGSVKSTLGGIAEEIALIKAMILEIRRQHPFPSYSVPEDGGIWGPSGFDNAFKFPVDATWEAFDTHLSCNLLAEEFMPAASLGRHMRAQS